jgi:hypothetical protein
MPAAPAASCASRGRELHRQLPQDRLPAVEGGRGEQRKTMSRIQTPSAILSHLTQPGWAGSASSVAGNRRQSLRLACK